MQRDEGAGGGATGLSGGVDGRPGMVDWDAAADIAARLVPAGPRVGRAERVELVGQLRASAGLAAEHVARISGLHPADGRPPAQASRVLVVDRAAWVRANVEVMAATTGGLAPSDDDRAVPESARLAAAAELGGMLALLSTKVLGQFDPFSAGPGRPGRLLLVAPTVLEIERSLGAAPGDFRLWVALHEQTHALQFAAAPWLADHLRSRTGELMADLSRRQTLPEVLRRAYGTVRGFREAGVLAVLSPPQRALFDEVGATMALLEGHADVTMDEVGPSVVRSVRSIRRAFEARRDAGAQERGLAAVIRRLLGMDLKLAQYRQGAAFVRAVRGSAGRAALDAAWSGPDALPRAGEITDPAAWVRRVHG